MRKLVLLVVGCTLAFATAAGKYSYKLDNENQKPKLSRCACSAKHNKTICSNIQIDRIAKESVDLLQRFYYNNVRSNFLLKPGCSLRDNMTDKSFNFGTCKAIG